MMSSILTGLAPSFGAFAVGREDAGGGVENSSREPVADGVAYSRE
jgi:hypothetical protein